MMSLKKIFCGALAASMIFSASVFAAPADSVNAKLAKIETDTYGTEQSGALLDRISRLEKSYNGQNFNGNMNARIDALYKNETNPGILAKINALEWNVDHEVQKGGLDTRLTTLENKILGKTSEGTFNERIRALAKASYGAEILPIALVTIPENTLIKVATTVPVGSKTLQEGDTIPIEVIEDVFVEDALVFAKGLPGFGSVVSVRRAKNIFSNGKIETDFHTLKAIDGQDVTTCTGVEAVEAMNTELMARGLSLLGQTFSGKNKSVEEVFVRGKNIDLPAGVELYLQIKTPIVVYGVRPTGNNTLTEVPQEQPATETPPPNDTGLLPDEMIAAPPKVEQPPADDEIIVQVDPAPPAPTQQTEPEPTSPPQTTSPEPRHEEGKTLDGQDGEVIEIFDED